MLPAWGARVAVLVLCDIAAICCVRACWLAAKVCSAAATSAGTVDAWKVLPSVLPDVPTPVTVAAVWVVSMLESSSPTNALYAFWLGAYPCCSQCGAHAVSDQLALVCALHM